MKVRISLIAVLVCFCCFCMAEMPAQQDTTPDYFLLPGCNHGFTPVPNPLRVSADTLKQHHLSGAMPAYPEAAKKQHVQGTVVLSVDIDKSGKVSQARILAGNPTLAVAAVNAVKQWTYRPVYVDGTAYPVTGDVLITFGLGLNPWAAERGESPLKVASCAAPGGVLAHSVEPELPPQARIVHVGGDVVLQITIDKQGRVADAKVVSGRPLLTGAALNAVKQWRYEPYLIGKAPVAVKTQIALKFH